MRTYPSSEDVQGATYYYYYERWKTILWERPGGGGGGVLPYVCILGMCERPPFSALNFCSGGYYFHKLPKNPFRNITILHFWRILPFRRTIIFKISLISTRSSPPTAGSALCVRQRRGILVVPDIRIFTLKTDTSSFRCPAFSCSKRLKLVPEPRIFKIKRLKLVPEPRIFTLDRELVPEPWPIFHFARGTYLPKLGWVPPPPPPPPPGRKTKVN